MPNHWTTYRLLCCAPGEMEAECRAFDAANAKFAEQMTMPRSILFALASPRADFDPRVHGQALESNIRFCDFSLHIFGESAPDAAFTKFVELAAACAADPAKPLRSAVAAFRNPEAASPEVAALRQRLIEGSPCEVHDFRSPQEFDAAAGRILAAWYALIEHARIEEAITPPPRAAAQP